MAAATVVAGVFVTACIVGEFWRGMKVRHALGGVSWPGSLFSMIARNRRRYGGYIVHLGIVVLFIGIAGSKGFVTEADIARARGPARPGGRLHAGQRGREPRRERAQDHHQRAPGRLRRRATRIATLTPGIDQFAVDETRASDVAIDSRPSRDLYVVLVQLEDGGVARLSVFVNPLVLWVWIAGIMIVAGGTIAAWPGSPSARRARAAAPAPDGRARA